MVMESRWRRNDGTSFSVRLRSYAVDFARPRTIAPPPKDT
jgi:hypothetical protein